MNFRALLPPDSVRVVKATTPEKSRPVQRAALSAAASHGVGAGSRSQPPAAALWGKGVREGADGGG